MAAIATFDVSEGCYLRYGHVSYLGELLAWPDGMRLSTGYSIFLGIYQSAFTVSEPVLNSFSLTEPELLK